MGEWLEYTLGEIAQINPTEKLPKGTRAKKVPMEALQPFTKNIPWYEDTTYNGGVKFRNGDTLIARITPSLENGKTAYVDILDDDEIGFGSTEFIVLREIKNISDKQFLYYLARSPEFRDIAIQSMTGSSGRQRVQNDVLIYHDFLLPPLKEQKAIAEVLSSLDDKIDLLHRQNKTLEELAQTLFRQWFIEEAKDEWEEYEIRDFATHKKVSIKPSKNPTDSFLHFSLPAFDTNKEPLQELGSDIKSNKYQVEPYSILMSKLNPKTPRVWDIYFEPEENSICSTEFQVVQPNDKKLFPFISTLLKSDKVRGDLSMSASGTSGSHQRVKPEDIFNITFLTPSVDKLKEFSNILEPNYLKQRKNQQQIKTLENLRDTLLPKLMSGEVRIQCS